MQSIDSIGFLDQLGWQKHISHNEIAPGQGFKVGQDGFSNYMAEAFDGVDKKQHDAANKMIEVDTRASDDLVGAMVANQEASLSFAMLTQVRNKLVGAVDDILKMPV
ncbi:flagellar hook-basal body complex protein FliE [Chromobacterium haemolyticum]|uniref:flagellar hook-basal body complex protein FliE n=1 Tax=Chromobacterium haemolyticum TaxID=394935 RepID=UPI0009D964B8|nr:flagellar hook-basal body complex protein FliE [Chromobacterium haemolyticum]OQS33882.1 hypothetical protein B0T39_20385 [Chromobacterium haemolyticum]